VISQVESEQTDQIKALGILCRALLMSGWSFSFFEKRKSNLNCPPAQTVWVFGFWDFSQPPIFQCSLQEQKQNRTMLLLSFVSCLLATLLFYKGYQWYTCLEYFLLAVVYLFQFNLSFSIFLSMKVLMSFFAFLFEIIYYSDDIKKLKGLSDPMTTWINPCHATLGGGDDASHYSTGTALDRPFHLIPSKHDLTTDHLRSKMFFAPCAGFSIPFTDDKVLRKRLGTCGKCDSATVAIYLLSCHKYLSYSCINPFRLSQ
jgi:hypothetical protein